MGNKKKFINKKQSATFQLLARDSSDPNYTDGTSGDRIFVRVDNNSYSPDSFFEGDEDGQFADNDPNSVFADAPDDCDDEDDGGDLPKQIRAPPQSAAAVLPDHVRREILELGFPDDGYNYLIHLREIKNIGGGLAYYHNSKAKLDQLPLDVKDFVGALDGTHVRATVPIATQGRFHGRKYGTPQNVLAAITFDLKFTYVLAGWEGSAHDSHVLNDALTRSGGFKIPGGKYYLGDAGYGIRKGIISSYRGVRYQLKEFSGHNHKMRRNYSIFASLHYEPLLSNVLEF